MKSSQTVARCDPLAIVLVMSGRGWLLILALMLVALGATAVGWWRGRPPEPMAFLAYGDAGPLAPRSTVGSGFVLGDRLVTREGAVLSDPHGNRWTFVAGAQWRLEAEGWLLEAGSANVQALRAVRIQAPALRADLSPGAEVALSCGETGTQGWVGAGQVRFVATGGAGALEAKAGDGVLVTDLGLSRRLSRAPGWPDSLGFDFEDPDDVPPDQGWFQAERTAIAGPLVNGDPINRFCLVAEPVGKDDQAQVRFVGQELLFASIRQLEARIWTPEGAGLVTLEIGGEDQGVVYATSFPAAAGWRTVRWVMGDGADEGRAPAAGERLRGLTIWVAGRGNGPRLAIDDVRFAP